jgi:uncharacterized protein YmfQ (DUF2313 family)
MAGEAEAVRALTLLVAVCEQAIVVMESLDPASDGRVIEAAERLRDLAGDEIMSGRLRAADKPTPI